MKLFVDIPNYEGKYKINREGCVMSVSMYDLDGKLINTFASIKEAVNSTGFQKGYIIACCKGKKESYKKYKWKYETI